MMMPRGSVPTARSVLFIESEVVGFVMPNDCGLEVPPPGVGLTTVTWAVAAAATSAATSAACNCPGLIKVVVLALPFHCTDDPATNPAPLTVTVGAEDPGSAA